MIRQTHTHTFLHHGCVCTFPLSWGLLPYIHCPWKEEECKDEGAKRRLGSEWYLLTNTKGNCAKQKKKNLLMLFTGSFVLSNQRVLWRLCSHDYVSPALIYQSCPDSSSHIITDHLMSCAKIVIAWDLISKLAFVAQVENKICKYVCRPSALFLFFLQALIPIALWFKWKAC